MKSLNPCSNGIQKYTFNGEPLFSEVFVLILVLMEYKNTTINAQENSSSVVLILVLMEYKNTIKNKKTTNLKICLNPCSNGIQKYELNRRGKVTSSGVLILVLMEYKNTIYKALKETYKYLS